MGNGTIKEFVDIWGVEQAPKFASTEDIESAEKHLGFSLPKEYVELVTKYGDVYCPNLLDEIVDLEAEIPDVSNFSLPSEMIEQTQMYIQAGMPEGFLAFASDCMGNLFCFKVSEIKQTETAGIWFFDHDFCEIEKINESFNDWLCSYIELSTANK